MVVCVLTVRLHAPWVHSLKEKRMELKSLLTRLRNTFNVSVAEVDEQDTHTVMVIGVAAWRRMPRRRTVCRSICCILSRRIPRRR